MSQMVFWMLGIAFSAGAMVFTVALDAHLAEFALAAIIATFIAISAIRDFHDTADKAPSHRAAVLIRHMGMLWCWAAMSLTLIYAFLLDWSAWQGVFFVVVLGAGLCLFIANVLDRDAVEDAYDFRMLGIVDKISKVQFGATCIAIGGLIAYGKLSVDAFGGDAKWAAVNILLCMGMALAGLSGFTIVQILTPDEEAVEAKERSPGPAAPRAQPPARAARPTRDEAPADPVQIHIPANRLRQAARST
jgi:hypothetical protein